MSLHRVGGRRAPPFSPRRRVYNDDAWRNRYFSPENLQPTLERVAALKDIVSEGMTLPELALRFILQHPAVSTVIPGMRLSRHVTGNTAVSDGRPLSPDLMAELRRHRWVRHAAPWSD